MCAKRQNFFPPDISERGRIGYYVDYKNYCFKEGVFEISKRGRVYDPIRISINIFQKRSFFNSSKVFLIIGRNYFRTQASYLNMFSVMFCKIV